MFALIVATMTPLLLGLFLLATEALDRHSSEFVGRIARVPVERRAIATKPAGPKVARSN